LTVIYQSTAVRLALLKPEFQKSKHNQPGMLFSFVGNPRNNMPESLLFKLNDYIYPKRYEFRVNCCLPKTGERN